MELKCTKRMHWDYTSSDSSGIMDSVYLWVHLLCLGRESVKIFFFEKCFCLITLHKWNTWPISRTEIHWLSGSNNLIWVSILVYWVNEEMWKMKLNLSNLFHHQIFRLYLDDWIYCIFFLISVCNVWVKIGYVSSPVFLREKYFRDTLKK